VPAARQPQPDADWTAFADALLQRAALVARVASDRMPDPFAGLKVDAQDVDALLADLVGAETGATTEAAAVEQQLAPQVAAARQELAIALQQDNAFARLAVSARLDDKEIEALALVCAVELDPRRQRLVAYLNDDVSQRRLTPFSLDLLLGAGASLTAGPAAGLRRAALLQPAGDEPWASGPIQLSATVAWWLAGDRSLDPDLPAGVEIVSGPGNRDATDTLVVAAGPDRVRCLQAVITSLVGTDFLITPEPANPSEWRAVIRQATLAGLGVIIELEEDLSPYGRDLIERTPHLSWGLIGRHDPPLASLPRRAWVEPAVSAAPATAEEWQAVFGNDEADIYALTAEQLLLVSRSAPALGGDVPAGVRRLAAGKVENLAARIHPERGWDDIVLKRERLEQLEEIVLRCRHRRLVFGEWGFSASPSSGVVALFAGPSGTGKTLAAEVIAGALGVDLYKIDLSNMVSKYIGDTEKNLSQVFDAAEASKVVLFFDEADALFGKRSEVSDAHDRYANIEVAYLLQRLERYDGVAVMATNMATNIDPAFLRRLHVVVEFPMPNEQERARLWDKSLATAAPKSKDLDLKFLAKKFELPGGAIRNAALTAAFLAADAGSAITMEVMVRALSRELRKLGRLLDVDEFGKYGALLSENSDA
jgi:AAA+ superfamily predicted ATPase